MKINEPNRDTLCTWSTAVEFHNSGNFSEAAGSYTKIDHLSGRMHYNIACAQIKLGNELEAIEHLTMAIEQDKHLAVAYCQRGTLCLQHDRIDESISDLEMTRDLLRGNTFIDYKPLGLLVRLTSFQVKHNLALAFIKANKLTEARTLFIEAFQDADNLQKKVVIKSLERLDNGRTDLLQCMHVSPERVFAPPKSVVKNLQKPGIVRRAKVVSAVNADDKTAMFEGSRRVRELKQKSETSEKKLNALQRFMKTLSVSDFSGKINSKGMKSSKSMSDLQVDFRKDDNSTHTGSGRRNPIAKSKRAVEKDTSGSTESLFLHHARLNRALGYFDKQLSSDVSDVTKTFQQLVSPSSWMKKLYTTKKQVSTPMRMTTRAKKLPVLVTKGSDSRGNVEQSNNLTHTCNSKTGQFQNISLYRATPDYKKDVISSTDRLQDNSDSNEKVVVRESDNIAPVTIDDVENDVTNNNDVTSDNMDATHTEVKSNTNITRKPRPPPPSYPPPPLPPNVIIFV